MSADHYPSIDGLRGLAVLAVIAFHLELPGWEGGYLGVDTFFVISGFIVTNVTLKRLKIPAPKPESNETTANGAHSHNGLLIKPDSGPVFSCSDFFLRRMKRLWPELYLVMTSTLIFGAAILRPGEYERVPLSGISQVLMSSNIRFWAESDSYFDEGAKEKPFLHCWSLAVEEQFYLLFAAFLTFRRPGKRFSRLEIFLLILACAGSYFSSIFLSAEHDSAVFYLLPFRCWQFLCGIIPAIILDRRRSPNQLKSDKESIVSRVGGEIVSLVLVAAFLLTLMFDTRLREISTVAPPAVVSLSVAALMTLFVSKKDSGHTSYLSRLVGACPIVFIGNISYSLYLWHWPLICFAQKIQGDLLEPRTLSGIVIILFSLSIFSHFCVTTPIRSIPNSAVRQFRGYKVAAGTPIFCFCLLCLSAYLQSTDLSDDFTIHNPNQTSRLLASNSTDTWRVGKSVESPAEHHRKLNKNARRSEFQKWRCMKRTKSTYRCIDTAGNCSHPQSKQVFVQGDSHATMVGGILSDLARELGFCLHIFSEQSCPPFIKGYLPSTHREKEAAACVQQRELSLKTAKGLPNKLDVLLLVSRWELYLDRLVLDRPRDMYFGPKIRNDLYSRITDKEKGQFQVGLENTFREYGPFTKSFAVISEVPMFQRQGWPGYCDTIKCQHFSEPVKTTLPFLSRQLLINSSRNFAPKVRILDPTPLFCNEQSCNPYISGILAFKDRTHLDIYGAKHLRNLFHSVL